MIPTVNTSARPSYSQSDKKLKHFFTSAGVGFVLCLCFGLLILVTQSKTNKENNKNLHLITPESESQSSPENKITKMNKTKNYTTEDLTTTENQIKEFLTTEK